MLVLGGTRFMGIRLVETLLEKGYDVTIATRGKHKDSFGRRIKRIKLDRLDENSVICALSGLRFDIVFDTSAYTPLSVRYALKHIKCNKYIQVSSAAVYDDNILVRKEDMVNPYNLPYQTEGQFSYSDSKKYAECVLCQEFKNINSAIVRVPAVLDEENLSEGNVSNRLYFYVEHIVKEIPFYEQNIDRPCCLIRTVDEANFLIHLATNSHNGIFNISSTGNITLRDIVNYIEEKTGKKAIIKTDAEKNPFPFGGYMFDLHKATNTGFNLTALSDWLYTLIDNYIDLLK